MAGRAKCVFRGTGTFSYLMTLGLRSDGGCFQPRRKATSRGDERQHVEECGVDEHQCGKGEWTDGKSRGEPGLRNSEHRYDGIRNVEVAPLDGQPDNRRPAQNHLALVTTKRAS